MIWLLLMCFISGGSNHPPPPGSIYVDEPACEDLDIRAVYTTYLPERPNYYSLYVPLQDRDYGWYMIVKFDSEASIEAIAPPPSKVRIIKLFKPRNSFSISLPEGSQYLEVKVFSPRSDKIPYVRSIQIGDRELCKNPKVGYLDAILDDSPEDTSLIQNRIIDESCGRRKVTHTELIVHGHPTKSGDWPWHVAISIINGYTLKYICGGTLLSKTLVLTAAHCASISGHAVVPESLNVGLGKYNLIGEDIASQERQVFEIIIYPKFNAITLNNDIALLKLKSEAVFNDYVQPACLWHPDNKIPTEDVFGTVVGWGFNHKSVPSPTLQKITIPKVSELECLKSNTIFFHKKLNTNNFCAGFANGTSVCNGDSGGGFMVFVPDTPGNTSQASGSWYVRGIVSLSLSLPNKNVCDPYVYTIFTDVEKYRDWLSKYLD